LTDKPSFRIDPTAATADSNQVERRDFALMLTHDIKNHLSMIVGFVEMLMARWRDRVTIDPSPDH
jgi:hypothetical protein